MDEWLVFGIFLGWSGLLLWLVRKRERANERWWSDHWDGVARFEKQRAQSCRTFDDTLVRLVSQWWDHKDRGVGLDFFVRQLNEELGRAATKEEVVTAFERLAETGRLTKLVRVFGATTIQAQTGEKSLGTLFITMICPSEAVPSKLAGVWYPT